MSIKVITATNANRSFPELLRTVEEGQTVEITSHGHTVGYFVPAADFRRDREVARDRLLAYFQERPGRKIQPWTRDELYEDGE